ncbi:MAG TPA: hypothetical protein VNZ58_07160, partial [Thermomicrobiales bacterium]|nr:hypothetical protein [Thermomicrobiales bacterium]
MAQQSTDTLPDLEAAAPESQPRNTNPLGRADRNLLKKTPGYYARGWHKLRKDKTAMVSLVLTVIILCFSFGAPIVSKMTGFDYMTGDYSQILKGPFENGKNILGTDNNGRDLLTRLAYGGRISMTVAVVALAFALTLGMAIGSISGYFGGAIDSVLMRFVDVILSIPTITLLLLFSVWFTPGPIG